MSCSDGRSRFGAPARVKAAFEKVAGWAALGVLLSVAVAEGQPDHGIVLADAVRIAFYEDPPASIAASMRSAVSAACSARGRRHAETLGSAASAWLCTGTPLRFFRGVDVLGNELRTGFVCDSDAMTPNLKFYLEDMFEDDTACLFVSFDVRTNKHSIDLNPP